MSSHLPTAPRLVLFDFDGTLADSRAWALHALNAAAARFGFRPLDAGQAEALRHTGTADLLRALDVRLWQVPRIARHLRAEAAAAPAPPLFPGTQDMLRQLHEAGIRLALVTSNAEANVRRALGPAAAACIAHWACDVALMGKASRFRAVLRTARVEPAAAFAIGDELRDIAAARAVGVPVGAVAWGYAAPEALSAAAPDTLFRQMGDIPARFGL
jgi:phosphoglycolate phosphatase